MATPLGHVELLDAYRFQAKGRQKQADITQLRRGEPNVRYTYYLHGRKSLQGFNKYFLINSS